MTGVAALLVTRNAERWIPELAASIARQSRPPDSIVVVDDNSTDSTVRMLRDLLDVEVLVGANSGVVDLKTRIARNFEQGLSACSSQDIVILGDHDDVWHDSRVELQARMLEQDVSLAMVASDGRIVDADGNPMAGGLRTSFPVPAGWASDSPEGRMREALRLSIATGAASAVRPHRFIDNRIPDGWLHDRWWSLIATAQESILLDAHQVIDYRVSSTQHVGLDPSSQRLSAPGRVVAGVRTADVVLRRLRDIHRDLVPLATARTASELRGARLLRNLL